MSLAPTLILIFINFSPLFINILKWLSDNPGKSIKHLGGKKQSRKIFCINKVKVERNGLQILHQVSKLST